VSSFPLRKWERAEGRRKEEALSGCVARKLTPFFSLHQSSRRLGSPSLLLSLLKNELLRSTSFEVKPTLPKVDPSAFAFLFLFSSSNPSFLLLTQTFVTFLSPFYPRGVVRALTQSLIPGRTQTTDSGITTLSSESDEQEEDDITSEDVIRPSEMEDSFKNLVLCSGLCNMATIHKGKEDRWEAAGDATGSFDLFLSLLVSPSISFKLIADLPSPCFTLTEIALQVFAHKLGHGKPHLTHPKKRSAVGGDRLAPVDTRTSENGGAKKVAMDGHYEMVVEHPFDSSVKRMSTVSDSFLSFDSGNLRRPADFFFFSLSQVWKYQDSQASEQADLLVFMKGAVERILDRCTFVGLSPDTQVKIDDEKREEIIARMDTLAAEGLRVLGLGARVLPREREDEIKEMKRDDLEKEFCFLGLVGI